MKIYLIVCLLFISEYAIGQATHIKGPTYEGYIFSASHKVDKWIFKEASGRFTPTATEIVAAERLLTAQLDEEKKISILQPLLCAELKMYIRQYVGFYDRSGHKVIWVNALLIRNYPFPASSQIVDVDDGGNAFWHLFIDLKKKKGYGFTINSMG